MRISVSIYGAFKDFEVSFLLRDFRLKYDASFLLNSVVVDLRKNLRQDVRLRLERIWNLDGEPASSEAKCLMNLGRTGRQPTMMPIAISARLDRYQ